MIKLGTAFATRSRSAPYVLSLVSTLTFAASSACSSNESDDGGGTAGGAQSGAGGNGGSTAAGAGMSADGTANGGTPQSAGAPSGGALAGTSALAGNAGAAAPTIAGAAGTPGGGSSGSPSAGASGALAGGAAGASSGSAGMPASGGAAGGSAGSGGAGGSGGGANALMNFFVTSDSSKTGDLGGLAKADMRCQALAKAVGHGDKTWRAYLSAANPLTHARDRIGPGPYYNSTGAMLAADKDALHARSGSAELFLDEKGNRINGQWTDSPDPNEHDILTGSKSDGTLLPNATCGDWTSTTGSSGVGHSDGLGPQMNNAAPYNSWQSSHQGQCGNTAPGGGAGKIYCFVGM